MCRRFLRGGRDDGRKDEPIAGRGRGAPNRNRRSAGCARRRASRPSPAPPATGTRPARFRARHVLPFAGAPLRSQPPLPREERGEDERGRARRTEACPTCSCRGRRVVAGGGYAHHARRSVRLG